MVDYEELKYDVLVIGAGAAGMRAAVSASDEGAKVCLVSKSLLGKAHTVMAEGGAAAALGNTISDCCGIVFGGYVEMVADRMGLAKPRFTEAEADHSHARIAKVL